MLCFLMVYRFISAQVLKAEFRVTQITLSIYLFLIYTKISVEGNTGIGRVLNTHVPIETKFSLQTKCQMFHSQI